MTRKLGLKIGTAVTATSTFTMTQLASAKRVYQRDTTTGGGQSKGQGRITVTISSATAGTVYARVRSSDTTTILQASFLAGTISNGQTSLVVDGIDARLGWFYLDLLDVSGTWKTGTTLVGMGSLTFLWGQSLASAMLVKRSGQGSIASAGASVDANGSCYATVPSGNGSGGALVTTAVWTVPGDAEIYNSAGAAKFLTNEISAEGVNCGLVGHSKGSTAASAFFGSGAEADDIAAIVTAVGGYEKVWFFEGHSDAASGTNGIIFRSYIFQTMEYLYQNNGKTVKTFKVIGETVPNESSGGTWGTSGQQNVIRRSGWEICAYDATRWGDAVNRYIQVSDIDLMDNVHQSQAGAVQIADDATAALAGTDMTGTASGLGNSKVDLTVASGTYAAGKFSNGLSVGRASYDSGANDPYPAVWVWTAWCKITASQSGRGIFFFNAQGSHAFMDSDDTIQLRDSIGNASFGTYAAGALIGSTPHYFGAKLLANGDREFWIDGVMRINGNSAMPSNGSGTAVLRALDTSGTWEMTNTVYDEVAWWCYDKDLSVVPSAALNGDEAGLIHLWHLDGNGTSGRT